jgi:hypothetical protein
VDCSEAQEKIMSKKIKASVGKQANGTKECHNVPEDQLAVIWLLNQIGQGDGGRKEAPLADVPRWGLCSAALYQAILAFQRRHGGLSADGHVDPNGGTLRKLNELALRAAPIGSNVLSFAIASLSWIDPMRLVERGVIETDVGPPPRQLPEVMIKNAHLCRFSNFLKVVVIIENGRITTKAIDPNSGIYQRPSFRGTPSESFPMKRQIVDLPDGVEFRQLVGCRTRAPELLAADAVEFLLKRFGSRWGSTGRALGNLLAKFGPTFPPIWTELAIKVTNGGACSGRVVRHSLFPSMTFYTGAEAAALGITMFERVAKDYYDGTAPQFDQWFLHGWGVGNPWHVPFPELTWP